MKRLRHALSRALTWAWLLQKRILKKPAFLVILVLTPLLAGGLSLVAQDNNGLMKAAVVWDPDDAYAAAFGEEILMQSGATRLTRCDSEKEARRLLEDGEVGSVWIIPKGLEEHLKNFVLGKDDHVAVIIVEREENVISGLTRDRLFTLLFSRLSYDLFRGYILDLGVTPPPTEEELQDLYDNTASAFDLMRFEDVRGETVEPEKFLISPVRGILSLLIVMGGVAAAIFCAQDDDAGVYQGLSELGRFPAKCLSVLLPMADLSVAAILSLSFTGLLTDPLYEVLLHLLFLLAAGGFCLVLLTLLRSPRRLAMAAFLTVIATLALTPVFVEVGGMDYLSALLPTRYYIRGVMVPAALSEMLLYALIAYVLAFAFSRIPRRDG